MARAQTRHCHCVNKCCCHRAVKLQRNSSFKELAAVLLCCASLVGPVLRVKSETLRKTAAPSRINWRNHMGRHLVFERQAFLAVETVGTALVPACPRAGPLQQHGTLDRQVPARDTFRQMGLEHKDRDKRDTTAGHVRGRWATWKC